MKYYNLMLRIVLVVLLICLGVVAFYQYALPQAPEQKPKTEHDREKVKRNKNISDYELARSKWGRPTIHKPEKAYKGYTLFCSTHDELRAGEKAHIYLVDMKGRIHHRWEVDTSVQLAKLQPDGSLFYITRDRTAIKRAGLRRLSPDSEVQWYYHCRSDHDFRVLDNGNFLIHCIRDGMVPALGPELKRNPYIIEITDSKKLVWEWHGENHVQELVERLGLDWSKMKEKHKDEAADFDWAHNNTVAVIPENASGEKDPRFEKGNLLFSYRRLSVVGVIDRESGEIVWAWGNGEIEGQHDVQMLPNGHLLMFDNGRDFNPPERGWSRVVEVDPLEEEVVWEYHGSPKESFYSGAISGVQKLPNGNIFICSGNERRLFEVTEDKEIVWEYKPPFEIKGTMGIYQATRYSPEYVRKALGKDSQ